MPQVTWTTTWISLHVIYVSVQVISKKKNIYYNQKPLNEVNEQHLIHQRKRLAEACENHTVYACAYIFRTMPTTSTEMLTRSRVWSWVTKPWNTLPLIYFLNMYCSFTKSQARSAATLFYRSKKKQHLSPWSWSKLRTKINFIFKILLCCVSSTHSWNNNSPPPLWSIDDRN